MNPKPYTLNPKTFCCKDDDFDVATLPKNVMRRLKGMPDDPEDPDGAASQASAKRAKNSMEGRMALQEFLRQHICCC